MFLLYFTKYIPNFRTIIEVRPYNGIVHVDLLDLFIFNPIFKILKNYIIEVLLITCGKAFNINSVKITFKLGFLKQNLPHS